MHRTWICLLALATVAHADPPSDPQRDFDFLLGSWTIKNRMLRKQPDGSERWVEFASTSVNRPIWDGKANVEEWDGMGPSGRIQGVAVRLYDPAHRTWSIYWGDRRLGAIVLPPVVGHFAGPRGEFFSAGTYDGKPSRDRVIWSRLTKDTCRWEQAMSLDGGKTWKTNWIMDFTRAP